MWILIVDLVLFAIVVMITRYIRNKRLRKKIDNEELDSFPEVKEVDVRCCGQHEVCGQDSLLAAVGKQIGYYDNEELDTFIGRVPGEYTLEEADESRDVFYTMQDTDIAGWVRNLQLRGISLPDEIRDEVFLVVGRRRVHPQPARLPHVPNS